MRGDALVQDRVRSRTLGEKRGKSQEGAGCTTIFPANLFDGTVTGACVLRG
jgi:hypothetical protein